MGIVEEAVEWFIFHLFNNKTFVLGLTVSISQQIRSEKMRSRFAVREEKRWKSHDEHPEHTHLLCTQTKI